MGLPILPTDRPWRLALRWAFISLILHPIFNRSAPSPPTQPTSALLIQRVRIQERRLAGDAGVFQGLRRGILQAFGADGNSRDLAKRLTADPAVIREDKRKNRPSDSVERGCSQPINDLSRPPTGEDSPPSNHHSTTESTSSAITATLRNWGFPADMECEAFVSGTI